MKALASAEYAAASVIVLPFALVLFAVIVVWAGGMAICKLGAWALNALSEHAEDFE